jgi:hypothetical protein
VISKVRGGPHRRTSRSAPKAVRATEHEEDHNSLVSELESAIELAHAEAVAHEAAIQFMSRVAATRVTEQVLAGDYPAHTSQHGHLAEQVLAGEVADAAGEHTETSKNTRRLGPITQIAMAAAFVISADAARTGRLLTTREEIVRAIVRQIANMRPSAEPLSHENGSVRRIAVAYLTAAAFMKLRD